mmetsp:Transcript_26769/g.54789  ORF Transcript_26769/g.54789 Transcript_26769/m.54789 type:complete len:407 (-) Transcript_26769:1492-2712(-)
MCRMFKRVVFDMIVIGCNTSNIVSKLNFGFVTQGVTTLNKHHLQSTLKDSGSLIHHDIRAAGGRDHMVFTASNGCPWLLCQTQEKAAIKMLIQVTEVIFKRLLHCFHCIIAFEGKAQFTPLWKTQNTPPLLFITNFNITHVRSTGRFIQINVIRTNGGTLDPPCVDHTFPLHLNTLLSIFNPFNQIKAMTRCITKKAVGHVRALDLHLFGSGLHARCKVHCIAKKTIPWHGLANHSSHYGATVDSCADLNGGTILGLKSFHKVYGIKCKEGYLLSSFRASAPFGGSTHHHVRISNCFNLVYLVFFHQFVEFNVQVIEHGHYLYWAHFSCHRSEPNYIREENGDKIIFFHYGHPLVELPYDTFGHHLVEELLVMVALDKDSSKHRCKDKGSDHHYHQDRDLPSRHKP